MGDRFDPCTSLRGRYYCHPQSSQVETGLERRRPEVRELGLEHPSTPGPNPNQAPSATTALCFRPLSQSMHWVNFTKVASAKLSHVLPGEYYPSSGADSSSSMTKRPQGGSVESAKGEVLQWEDEGSRLLETCCVPARTWFSLPQSPFLPWANNDFHRLCLYRPSNEAGTTPNAYRH